MTCEHLICAQCASPVVEGRCPACRLAKGQVHHHGSGLSIPVAAAALTALLVLLIALRLAH